MACIKCGIIDLTPARGRCDGNSYTYITPASRKGEGIGSKLLYARQLVINISPYATGTMCVSLTLVFKRKDFVH